jgi:cytochrome b6-f complex iron-sulfur subunit
LTAVESTTPKNTPTTGPRSRRDVLCGLLVAIVAPGAVVAACSSGSDSSGTSSTPTNNTGDSGTSAGGGASAGLVALSEVPDGGGAIVENPDGGMILVVREGSEVKAYNAACTHQGTTVDAPVDGSATCPNHGSVFAIADGSVEKGPATQPLATINVKVEGDQVVLA